MTGSVLAAQQARGFGVAVEAFGGRIEAQFATDAGGEVAEVSEGGGEMSDFDVGVRSAVIPDGVEEVAVMGERIEAGIEFFAELVLGAEELPARLFAEDEQAFGAVEGVAVFVGFLDVGRPDALFVDELLSVEGGSPVLVDDVLGVGEFLIVVEEAFRAGSDDARGVGFHAEAPSSDVDFVDAVITDVAGTEGVAPAPDTGEKVGLVGDFRCGTEPEIEVEVGRGRGGRDLTDVAAELAVPGFGHQHFADGAFAQELHCSLEVGCAAALGADLDHALVTACGFDHEPAFPEVVGAGFLDVDMLTGLAGEESGGCVPVVRGGDDHGVDGPVLEDAAHVLVGARHLAGGGFDDLGAGLETSCIDITDPGDVDVGLGGEGPEQVGAVAAGSDHAENQSLAGVGGADGGRGGMDGGGEGDSGGALLEERSARGGVHAWTGLGASRGVDR